MYSGFSSIYFRMASLTWTCSNQGRWWEAEDVEVEALEKREKVLRADHPDTLTSMINLSLGLASRKMSLQQRRQRPPSARVEV